MRVSRKEADQAQEVIMRLVNGMHSVPGGFASMPSAPPPSPTSAAAAPPAVGVAEELRQLAELKNSGVLTDEEFEAQKARLLGS